MQAAIMDDTCASSPHDLPLLLSSLGLPLVSRTPRPVELAILADTPGSVVLTPGLVRAHLVGAGHSLMQTLQRHDKQAADSRSAALDATTIIEQPGQALQQGLAQAPGHDTTVRRQGQDSQHGPSAGAVLLLYCLHDFLGELGVSEELGGAGKEATQQQQQGPVSVGLKRALEQLSGLPLLPLADQGLGRLQALGGRGSTAGGCRDGRGGTGGGNVCDRLVSSWNGLDAE